MKKYLVKGALALFVGTLFYGCAEQEAEYVPLAEQKVQAFEDVFKEVYGEVDPYQDWGFSSGKVEVDENDSSQVVEVIDVDGDVAYTRAIAFDGMSPLLAFNTASTRSAYPNANQWAQSYNVPDPLTAGQKARVQFYFQNVQYPGGTEDNGILTFFVQQVYDGGDDPLTKYDGYSSYSKEVYLAANGSTYITSGEHMDHLTAGSDNEHIYNFNNGTCSTNCNVGNNGAALDTEQHCDEIMLMINTKTNCFGYANSDASYVRKDRYRLVSGAVIDQWINDHYSAYKAWLDKHSGVADDIVDDRWHRSFIGFDFDMIPDDKTYAKNSDNSIRYLTYGDLPDSQYAWDGISEYGGPRPASTEFVLYNGKRIPMLISDTNMYAGENGDIDQNQLIVSHSCLSGYQTDGGTGEQIPYYQDQNCLDLSVVNTKLAAGFLPVVGSTGCKWVKIGGTDDGYYSDWIVSIMAAGGPAQPSYLYPEDKEEWWKQIDKGRVFCEDLGQSSREDLDYNDVVFDAIIFQHYKKVTVYRETYINGVLKKTEKWSGPTVDNEYYANVELLAAGGTIPITVAGYPVHNQFTLDMNNGQVTTPIEMMVNTRDNNSNAYGSYAERKPVQIGNTTKNFKAIMPDGSTKEFTLKLIKIDERADKNYIGTIPIISSYNGQQVHELQGTKGGAPQKFMAPVGTRWTTERKNISLAYPQFDAWVKGGAAPWSTVNTNYIYDKTLHSNSVDLPLVMKANSVVNTEGEQNIWTGSQPYGPNWSLANLEATLDLDKFYPGDRLRFWGENIGVVESDNPVDHVDETAWITVVIGDITPYFIDSEFPDYYLDSNGNKVTRTTGCIEVLLDENAAKLLNSKVSNGKVTFQVQGRNFTLTRICRVLF